LATEQQPAGCQRDESDVGCLGRERGQSALGVFGRIAKADQPASAAVPKTPALRALACLG